jgi:O-antigen/teichoic acid export membrane protein
MNLGREAAAHFLTQLVVSLAGFVSTFAIAVLLGADGLGTYVVGLAIGHFWIQIPADAFSSAIAKRVSEAPGQDAIMTAGFAGIGIIAVLSAALILGFSLFLGAAGPISGTEFERALRLYGPEVALLAVSTGFYKGVNGGLRGEKKVALAGLLTAGERSLRTGLQVGAMTYGLGVEWLFLSHAGSVLVATVVGVGALDTNSAWPAREQFKSLYSYARYAWLGALEARTFGWVDTLVLSFIAPAGLIGIYEAAWGLGSLLRVISGSIQQTLFPEVSELSTADATGRILHYLDEAMVFAGLLIIPGLVGSIVVGERILRFYDPSFVQGTGILILLVTASLFNVYSSQIINIINAMDRPDITYGVSRRVILANVGLNVGLGVSYGWWGVATATGLSAVLRLFLGYRGLSQFVERVGAPLYELARQLVAALLMGGAIAYVEPNVPTGRLNTVLLVGLGALLYSATVVGLSPRVRGKIRVLSGSFGV